MYVMEGRPQQQQQQQQQLDDGLSSSSTRDTVSSACTNCRSKHLKCNGNSPCSRCSSEGLLCNYVKSRRGYKGPRRTIGSRVACRDMTTTTTTATMSTSPDDIFQGIMDYENIMTSTPQHLTSTPISEAFPSPDSIQRVGPPYISDLTVIPNNNFTDDIGVKCIEAFFSYFHRSHPFVLPRSQFLAYITKRPLPLLNAVIRYIGSCYVPTAPKASFFAEVESLLVPQADTGRDAFMVQALLLMTIVLDGHRELARAAQMLASASNLALELGMQDEEFAPRNNQGSVFLEESWRRTFWELYVVDGMIAGMHQSNPFRLQGIFASARLPCEEKQYELGLIPPSLCMKDFDESSFLTEDVEFSSFAYRIIAARNLGDVLVLSPHIFPDDPAFARTDANLVNWKLHLPFSKSEFTNEDGRVDEMLFQAHMVTNASLILLHRRHANLNTSVARVVTSCTPDSDHTNNTPSGYSHNIHATKAIAATQNLTRLITLPYSILHHTPFFICSCTLASIIHLSCWSFLTPLMPDDDLKQQLKLNTGALKKLAEVWPSAVTALGQVKGVAQKLLLDRKRVYGFWNSITEEELLTNMITDEGVMESVQ